MRERDSRIEDLILGHLEGTLDPDEEESLADVLETSSSARQLLASYLRLEGATMRLARAGAVNASPEPPAPRAASEGDATPPKRRKALRWALAASLLVAGIIAYSSWRSRDEDGNRQMSSSDVPVATLVQSVDAQVLLGGRLVEAGETLSTGALTVLDGLAEVRFESGAVLILEGPASLDLISADRSFLHRGRLRALVPPEARGFTVEAGDLTLVDLGTEFGMLVEESGQTEVHVFDGEVELEGLVSQLVADGRRLREGEALRVERGGRLDTVDANPGGFIGPGMIEAVVSSYLDELAREIETLEAREKGLSLQLKAASQDLKESPELEEPRRRLDEANRGLAEFRAARPEIAAAERKERELQRNLDDRLKRAVQSSTDPAIRDLRERLSSVDTTLRDLRRRLRAPRGGRRKAETRQLRAAVATAQREQKRLKKAMTRARSRLISTYPELAALRNALQTARSATRALPAQSEHRRLKDNVADAKRHLRSAQRKLQEDADLRKLQADKKVVSSRLRAARRSLRNARKAEPRKGG